MDWLKKNWFNVFWASLVVYIVVVLIGDSASLDAWIMKPISQATIKDVIYIVLVGILANPKS